MEGQQKEQEKHMKAIAGHTEGLVQTIEAAYPSQEFVNLVKGTAAHVLAVLESHDLTLEDTQRVLAALSEKASQSKLNDDPELYAAFLGMMTQYVRGQLGGIINKKKLSTLKLDT